MFPLTPHLWVIFVANYPQICICLCMLMVCIYVAKSPRCEAVICSQYIYKIKAIAFRRCNSKRLLYRKPDKADCNTRPFLVAFVVYLVDDKDLNRIYFINFKFNIWLYVFLFLCLLPCFFTVCVQDQKEG